MKKIMLLMLLAISSNFCRAQTSGIIDSSFNSTGIVDDTACGIHFGKTSLLIQPDGKIITCGYKNAKFSVVRYMPDGTRDLSFNGNGNVVIANTTDARSCALQADNKILIGGHQYAGGDQNFCIARLNSNGSVDSTFGTNGIAFNNFGTGDFSIWDIAIQNDGKIIAVGEGVIYAGLNHYCAIARYNMDGTLDGSFGNGGLDTLHVTDYYSIGYSVVIQPDQKIVVTGTGETNLGLSVDSIFVLRINSNGTRDINFGINGVGKYDFADYQSHGYDVLIQPDKKIVVCGSSSNFTTQTDFEVIRIDSTGALDASFNGGHTIINMFGYDEAYAVTEQSDGKIILAGYSESNLNQGYFALCRVNSNGIVDSSFGIDGRVFKNIYFYSEKLSSVLMQPDGKIVTAGLTRDQNQLIERTVVMRFLSESISNSMDENNFLNTTVTLYPNPANAIFGINFLAVKNASFKLEIINVVGEVVIEKNIAGNVGLNNIPVNIEILTSGIYFIKLANDKGVITKKFIKE